MRWAGLVGWLVLAGGASCSRRASVSVRNDSATEVSALQIEGRCFREDLGVLAPDASTTVRVQPCAESGVRVTFSANGTIHQSPEQGYIEASDFYVVRLVIRPDLSVVFFNR
jgi:hypothetical protein